MRRFKRLCGDGWEQGWHERNGGNLSYRMDEEDVKACLPYFNIEGPGHEWHDMEVQAENLVGAFFIVTGAGKYMRNVNIDPASCIGIVEINGSGDAWRIVWGLTDGGAPSSEFPTHFLSHSVRMTATEGASHVIYHAHCPGAIALSTILEPDAMVWSRALWRSMTECILVFPQGVGVVPWMVPGGADIAKATCAVMENFQACVWTQHGLFVSGTDFDEAFGLMHTIEKSAQLYLTELAASGGREPSNLIADDQLKAVCEAFNVQPNADFLV